jgi:hypothetical protein
MSAADKLFSDLDVLEKEIREFLLKNERGGRFIFRVDHVLEPSDIILPMLINTFEQDGWMVDYDYDDDQHWLRFRISFKKELDFLD